MVVYHIGLIVAVSVLLIHAVRVTQQLHRTLDAMIKLSKAVLFLTNRQVEFDETMAKYKAARKPRVNGEVDA